VAALQQQETAAQPTILSASQDAINLFLGNFVPDKPGQPELWDLENDVYLHAAGRQGCSTPAVFALYLPPEKSCVTADNACHSDIIRHHYA
jgi:hypothetical protein